MNLQLHAWLKDLTKPRHGSRAHLALAGAGVVFVLVLGAAFALHFAHRARPAAQAVAAVPAPAPAIQPAPAAPRPVIAAVPGAPVAAPAATAAQPPVAAAAPVAPPAGLVAGQVMVTDFTVDQFGGFVQTSQAVKASVSTSWSATAPGGAGWQKTFTGWFRLSAPARVAVLRRGGGIAARHVRGAIDGTELGPSLVGVTASETASITLAAGWHTFEVSADSTAGTALTPTAVELLVGDGVTEPAPVVPYAVPAHVPAATAPASAASVPAQRASTTGEER